MAISFVGKGAVSFIETSTNFNISVTYPTGIQSGDFAILVLNYLAPDGESLSLTLPSGFVSNSISLGVLSISTRVCNGTESGSSISTSVSCATSALVNISCQVLVYRGVDTTTSLISKASSATGSVSSVSFPSLSTGGLNGCLGVHILGARTTSVFSSVTGTPPATWTEVEDWYFYPVATTVGSVSITMQIEHKFDIATTEASVSRTISAFISGTKASFVLTPSVSLSTYNTLFFGNNF